MGGGLMAYSYSSRSLSRLVGFVKAKWAELAAAGRVNGRLVCGADWKSFPDGPHYQIDR